jgi:hypothetical protein
VREVIDEALVLPPPQRAFIDQHTLGTGKVA